MTIKPFSVVILASVVTFLALVHTGCSKTTTTTHDTTVITKMDTVAPVPPDITTGLVLYLNFNGSFADSSGLNNTVTAVNGATLGYDMHGYAQSAFTSSGNGAELLVTNNGSFAVDTAFSVSFDFMIRSNAYYSGGGNYSGLMTFLSIVNYTNGNSPTFNVGVNLPGAPQLLNFDLNSSTSECGTPGQGNPLNRDDTSYSFSPQIGSWYNAVCIFKKGTASTYINGQLVSSTSGFTDSVLFCPDAQFVVGGWWNGTESINGEIDEVRFYNRTLTSVQITYLARNFQINSNKQNPGLQSGKATSIGGR